MKALIQVFTLSAILITWTEFSSAEGTQGGNPTAAPKIENRVERQKHRINRKLRKGKISQDQAAQLNKNVDAVQAERQSLASDGKLTKPERKRLRQQLNQNSEAIKQAGGSTGNQ